MLSFDYAIAVGVCTLVVLVGLRAAIPLMRSSARRRTDELLLRIHESEQEGNNNAATEVVLPDDPSLPGGDEDGEFPD